LSIASAEHLSSIAAELALERSLALISGGLFGGMDPP
jgi:hypothetical protein